jgi:hypothetical protein
LVKLSACCWLVFFVLPATLAPGNEFARAPAEHRQEQRLKAQNDVRTAGIQRLALLAVGAGSLRPGAGAHSIPAPVRILKSY